jgi:hypothetical protein
VGDTVFSFLPNSGKTIHPYPNFSPLEGGIGCRADFVVNYCLSDIYAVFQGSGVFKNPSIVVHPPWSELHFNGESYTLGYLHF